MLIVAILVFSLNASARIPNSEITQGDTTLYNALDQSIMINIYQGCDGKEKIKTVLPLPAKNTYGFFFKPTLKQFDVDTCDYIVTIEVRDKNNNVLIQKNITQGRYFITYNKYNKTFEILEIAF